MACTEKVTHIADLSHHDISRARPEECSYQTDATAALLEDYLRPSPLRTQAYYRAAFWSIVKSSAGGRKRGIL
jgi:hypothetical protein